MNSRHSQSARILKFGGAGLETPERLASLTNIVKRSPPPRAVVVSAVAGTTDRLHELVDQPLHGQAIRSLIDDLAARHRSLAPTELGIEADLSLVLDELRLMLEDLRGRQISPRAHERIISTGERLAAVLVAGHLKHAGILAAPYPSERAGICCDARFGAASIDYGRTKRQLATCLGPFLERGGVPVVTGYYGMTPDGDVATFGRSGSDYTATVLGRCLGADRVEMWKHVGGFLDADPRVMPNARVIPQLSYDEAAELSFYGAQVIHPRALDPVRDDNIPIYILDVDRPDAAGTRITAESSVRPGSITAVSSRKGLTMLRAFIRAGTGHQDTMAAIAERLAIAGVNILNTATAQTSLAVLIEANHRDLALEATRDLPNGWALTKAPMAEAAMVCAVGQGLGESKGMLGRILCTVGRAGVEVEMVCAGASPVACHLTVAEADLATATQAIYREFFEIQGTNRSCAFSSMAPGTNRGSESAHSERLPMAQTAEVGHPGSASE